MSPFQYNLRGGYVQVPEDTFKEMIAIIAEYAGKDHAEGAPAAAVLHKGDGNITYHLLATAQNLPDGPYALHAIRITDSEAAALSQAPTTKRLGAAPIK